MSVSNVWKEESTMGCTAVSGWLCKISKSLGNLCIKLSLPGVWVMKKLCCLFSYFHTSAGISLCRYQHIWRSQGLRLQKPECFVCYTIKEVCTVLHFTFHACCWKRDWGRIHFFRIYLGLWVLGCLRDFKVSVFFVCL